MKHILRSYIAVGLWLIVSPWVLGFSSITILVWSNIAAGLATILLALWGLYGFPPEQK